MPLRSFYRGNGEESAYSLDLTGFTNEWGWRRVTMGGGNATLDLTETGAHTLDAWMREDGLRVDRTLLVTDTNYIPSIIGYSERVCFALNGGERYFVWEESDALRFKRLGDSGSTAGG